MPLSPFCADHLQRSTNGRMHHCRSPDVAPRSVLRSFTRGADRRKNSLGSHNPYLIKKQRELYKNAKIVKKYKKLSKHQNASDDCSPSISFPEPVNTNNDTNKKNTEVKWNKKKEKKKKKKKKKNSLQSAMQEYERRREEEDKVRAEREALIQLRKEERARIEDGRKMMRAKMFKRTRSGQPVMKHRFCNLLQAI